MPRFAHRLGSGPAALLALASLLGLALPATPAVALSLPASFEAELSADALSPSSGSEGTGQVRITLTEPDELFLTRLGFSFSDLEGNPFVATGGLVFTAPTAPAGAEEEVFSVSGSFLLTLSTSIGFSDPPSVVIDAEEREALAAGDWFVTLETDVHPEGEIGGALLPVPEPGTGLLFAAGLGALAAPARRRRPRGPAARVSRVR